MSTAISDPDRIFTREEYRLWCDAHPGRYERVDGRIFGMASERVIHARVKSATWAALRRAVAEAGVMCEALPDGITVETGENDYEPDALVNCGTRMANNAIAAPNPIVVVEVLSPGTSTTDTGGKLAGYFQVVSVAHYLIIHPTRRMIIHHRRMAEVIDTRIVFDGSIAMDPPGITITVDEIYETS